MTSGGHVRPHSNDVMLGGIRAATYSSVSNVGRESALIQLDDSTSCAACTARPNAVAQAFRRAELLGGGLGPRGYYNTAKYEAFAGATS
jgi:hypothetical protein